MKEFGFCNYSVRGLWILIPKISFIQVYVVADNFATVRATQKKKFEPSEESSEDRISSMNITNVENFSAI